MSRLAAPLACALALAACSNAGEGTEPAPVTQDEADALEDAASMLDEQRLPDDAQEPGATEGETE